MIIIAEERSREWPSNPGKIEKDEVCMWKILVSVPLVILLRYEVNDLAARELAIEYSNIMDHPMKKAHISPRVA